MSRVRVVQAAPAVALDRFPTHTHRSAIYRVARHWPWWFCTCGECRFDLDRTDPRGNGTLYAGTDCVTGVLETIGPEMQGGVIAREFLTSRAVWELIYDRPVRLADLTDRTAIAFGVTNELGSMVPYTVPQAWAAAFVDLGLDGISYRTRFNTAPEATGVALFDEAGSHPDWPAVSVGAADGEVIVEALHRRSITVADAPVLGALTVI